MISIMLLIGGLQLFCIGIVGEYLSKTYTESSIVHFISLKKRTEKIVDSHRPQTHNAYRAV